MNTLICRLAILVGLPLLFSGCGAQAGVIHPAEPGTLKTVAYEAVLGKPVTDQVVTDFIVDNACASADPFLLCKTAGMALWIDSNQTVETVYLYLNHAEGFESYRGELPYGLKFYDTLGAVEYKLKRRAVGNAGRPDFGEVPDHTHYRAIYKQAGMTVVYNFPFADEDATIYAILIRQKAN